ncbi:methyltransferase domain-containing protein [Pseudidiomarina donghaiensis]|uniref:tRNA 5-carboxymethoxyuridine methyltransferase n=1 Tax=Pseudidiomarina donghaiensis TaxID=519452 RepID=A0A432XC44_9GAMM|nr:methyltransferase domain-containing protein [Pseudidiomarina donghaiensis]RUO46216.1 methyltransferase domain-containing protein [Pseudidiomarina donghaiensis]SFV24822.1 S-adenosylmethionine-dependent methyltransferase [Pseudidiomarina donghaiensis]
MLKKQARKDTSFDGRTQKFSKNIYATTKGKLRLAVLERDLQPLYEQAKQQKLRVLDVGGGLGQLSMRFAELGCDVTHTDISDEIVEAAKQVHQKAGVAERYRYLVAPLQALPESLKQTYDVVLCHAVLEWLSEPRLALDTLKQLMSPQGHLSLMFYNRDAKILANVIFGNFDYVQADLTVKKTVRMSPQQPLSPQQVEQWIGAIGLTITEKTGVRCFHDYLRNRSDQQRFDELLALELKYNRQAPFVDIGRYLHWQIRHA